MVDFNVLFFWLVAAYGMSNIIVYGSIFSKPREWITQKSNFFGDLISCLMCTSTWVGFFMSLTLGSISTHFVDFFPLNLLIDAAFTSGGVWAINSIVEYYEQNRPQQNNIL